MFDFNKARDLYNTEYSNNKMMQKFIRKLFKFIADNNLVIPISPHKLMLPDFPISCSKDIMDFFAKLGYQSQLEFLPHKLIIFLKAIEK